MIIRIDTREQHPLSFIPHGVTATVRATVPVFDYAIDGDQDLFAVERKGLPDLISSVATDDRYQSEVDKCRRARAAGMKRLYYVVESTFAEVDWYSFRFFKSGAIGPQKIYDRWSEFVYRMGVNVVWAGNADYAARAVYLLLVQRQSELMRPASGGGK